MTINCIIIDDEPIARELLKRYITQVPYLNLVACCQNTFEGMEVLNNQSIDLIILDINMPQLTGLEMLRSLKNYPAVIITSAYPEYALEGFELSVTDYLLKPFSFPRFVQATEKLIKKEERLSQRAEDPPVNDFVMVRSDKRLTKIFFEDISYIEAHGNYISIYYGKDRIISKQTLTKFEELLPADEFTRTHKSYIVSLKAIQYLEGNQIALSSTKLPVGKAYKETLMQKLKN